MTILLNRRLHGLLKQLGLSDQKDNLIEGVTNGRSTSSKDLTDEEALTLIEQLTKRRVFKKQDKAKQLAKAFALFRVMKFTTDAAKLDYDRINNFCLSKTAAKKELTNMDKAELTTLIYQLEKINKK